MTPLEKLKNLQSGKLGIILDTAKAWDTTTQPVALLAAKVEVTKVVVDAVIGHLDSVRHDLWDIGGSEIEGSPLWETRQALTLLQQLKESL